MAAIGPVGSMIYTNQNVTAAATKQTAVQNRNEMQNVMANAITNEKETVVKEVRPTEATYKIDPEKEHQKQKNEEESGAKEEETTKDTKHKHLKESEDDDTSPTSRLDITA
jgi:hypothetical protein